MKQRKFNSFKMFLALILVIPFAISTNIQATATQEPLDILGEDEVVLDIDVIIDESLGDGFIPSLARNSNGTIRYAGGGHTGGTVPSSHTLSVPGSAVLRQPGTMVRSGHTFAGWRSSSSGNVFAAGATVIFSNPGTVTYTAVWNANSSSGTIRYAGGGHTSGTVPSSHSAPIGVPTALRQPGTMARSGHTFSGWRSSSSGNVFQPGQTVTFSTTNTTTYTAVWTPNNNNNNAGTIRYDGGGHTGGTVPSSHSAPIGVATALRQPGTMVRTGHTFAGWRSSASRNVFRAGERVTFSTTNTTTYTAVWVRNSMSWYGTGNRVFFWPGTVNVHVRTVGSVSSAFNFTERVRQARNAWGSELGINIGTATQANAQIIATGGPRAYVERDVGVRVGSTDWHGRACILQAPLTLMVRMPLSDTYHNSAQREISRLSGQVRMWVVQRPDGNVARTQKTTNHELGHALGFWEHSTDIRDVMYEGNTANYSIRSAEGRHLRQIYDLFR